MISTCPKQMRFGPCGGVRADGSCEVPGVSCPFFFLAGDEVDVAPLADAVFLAVPSPTILVDVRSPAGWSGDVRSLWRQIALELDGCVALLGEHVDNPIRHDDAGELSPLEVISILASAGVAVIATVTGRDRDIAAARSLMSSYVAAGACAVHCVTGDHPAALGIDRPAHFGTEAMALAAAAASMGIAATVGESPMSPGDRVRRLLTKERAGASLCVLNHAGESGELIQYARDCRTAGVRLPLVAPVPMVGDKRAALGLATFPGVRLPSGYLDAIIQAEDPLGEGLRAAGSLTRDLAASGLFQGVNLSGSATGSDPWERLRSTARFIEAARDAWGSDGTALTQ